MTHPVHARSGGVSRRQALRGTSLVAGLALLAAGGCASGTAARTRSSAAATAGASAAGGVTIGLSYTPNVQFAPFYLAQEHGWYTDAVSLRHHGAQEGLFDALVAGEEQLVVAGADEAAVAASNGADLVVVGGYYQTYPGCVLVREDSTITSLADLRGHSIGVPGRYGESWFALTVALDTAGLSEEEVDVVEIGYTQQAALVAGKVDAVMGFTNNDAVLIERAGTPVRTLAVAAEVPLIGASLVTTSQVLAGSREALSDAVTASARGMAQMVADPDGAVAAAASYVTDLADAEQAASARAVAEATSALVAPAQGGAIGSLDRDRFSGMLAFLESHSLVTAGSLDLGVVCQPLL